VFELTTSQIIEDEAEITTEAGDLWMGIELFRLPRGHAMVVLRSGCVDGELSGGGALLMSVGWAQGIRSEALEVPTECSKRPR